MGFYKSLVTDQEESTRLYLEQEAQKKQRKAEKKNNGKET